MIYATQQNMVDRFGEREVIALTDRDNTGVIDSAVLSQGLASASDEIDTYLAGRYTLPLASTPLIVRDFACDVARYRLCSAEVTETEEVRNRYKDAIKFFDKVSTGQISLGLDGLNQAQVPAAAVLINTNDRVFNQSSLSDY